MHLQRLLGTEKKEARERNSNLDDYTQLLAGTGRLNFGVSGLEFGQGGTGFSREANLLE